MRTEDGVSLHSLLVAIRSIRLFAIRCVGPLVHLAFGVERRLRDAVDDEPPHALPAEVLGQVGLGAEAKSVLVVEHVPFAVIADLVNVLASRGKAQGSQEASGWQRTLTRRRRSCFVWEMLA